MPHPRSHRASGVPTLTVPPVSRGVSTGTPWVSLQVCRGLWGRPPPHSRRAATRACCTRRGRAQGRGDYETRTILRVPPLLTSAWSPPAPPPELQEARPRDSNVEADCPTQGGPCPPLSRTPAVPVSAEDGEPGTRGAQEVRPSGKAGRGALLLLGGEGWVSRPGRPRRPGEPVPGCQPVSGVPACTRPTMGTRLMGSGRVRVPGSCVTHPGALQARDQLRGPPRLPQPQTGPRERLSLDLTVTGWRDRRRKEQ